MGGLRLLDGGHGCINCEQLSHFKICSKERMRAHGELEAILRRAIGLGQLQLSLPPIQINRGEPAEGSLNYQ